MKALRMVALGLALGLAIGGVIGGALFIIFLSVYLFSAVTGVPLI
jgi:hypothetical protein